MNEESDLINRMRAITVSREYGSGGGEIASRLARRLGWDFIDHAIVERTASEMSTSLEDVERASYLQREYHYQPDDAHLYDLVLNTSLLDLESAAQVICFTLQQKAKGLATKTGELGPARGLARYPAQPEDFPSLTRLVPLG